MTTTFLFQISLLLATFLCSLVAGLVLCFAIVVMPGTKVLDDRDFLRAFKVMDRVIQDNQPIFMLVWVGSIATVVAAMVIGFTQLSGKNLYLLLIAALSYLFGVQLPTIRFNIPLNNKLQTLNLDEMSEPELAAARSEFEPNWNRWNRFRTFVSCFSITLFLILISVL